MKTRLISMLLAVFMIAGMLPMSVFAASDDAKSVNGPFVNSQLSLVSDKKSTLATGVTQNLYTVYDKNGKQVKMYAATVDMSVDSVKLFTSYANMDNHKFAMSKLSNQVESFNQKAAAGDPYYQGTVVAGINASYYNMSTGQPMGVFVMNGYDATGSNGYPYFAVMKDGSVKIGKRDEYTADKGNIQEAIGIHILLLYDGKIALSESQQKETQKYPRQTIGITADGKVIILSADGNQEPTSAGLTLMEQAQVMRDLGCVYAGHLDGGGSMTYGSKAEGENEFVIRNNPSDGAERAISNGLIVVSTAVSDGKFDHANMSVEKDYVTPKSTVAISANGVDKVGGAAQLPDEATLQLKDASMGEIIDGAFVSSGKVGDAVIQMVYKGNVVGETTVHVVIPDIAFTTPEMIVPYNKTFTLNVVGTTNGGLNSVAMNAGDIEFELSDANMGTIKGNSYTTCNESTGIKGGNIIAKCVWDETKTAIATVKFGRASEIIYDFENGDATGWRAGSSYQNTVYGRFEKASVSIVDAATGKVRNGKYALALTADFSTTTASGYKAVKFTLPKTINLNDATSFGMWMYLPVDANNLEFDFGSYEFYPEKNSNINGEGWYYISASNTLVGASVSKFTIYMTDPDETYANIFDKFTIYIDDVTLDYSNATDDREIPQFKGVSVSTGLDSFVPMDGQTINTNTFIVKANAQDDLSGNYTGLNTSSAKVYVDGVLLSENQYSCDNGGVITVSDITLPNGTHTFRFEISDNNGNVGFVTKQIVVNEDNGDVSVVRRNSANVQPLAGSVEYFDVVAKNAENISSINLKLDLDTLNAWELQGADVAYGFKMSYSVNEISNTADITLTRTDKATVSGEAVIASLPVRVWQTKSYLEPLFIEAGLVNKPNAGESNSVWSPDIMWQTDRARYNRIELNAESIAVQYVDSTNATFSQKQLNVITEYNRYRSAGYYDESGNYVTGDTNFVMQGKKSTHVHSTAKIADKAATCTEDGYKNRTYCDECKSVIDWGERVSAKGHSYKAVDGVIKCTVCGTLFNGVYTDGKTYVDGVVVANGWNGDSYYIDGLKLTGLQKIDGYYYDFGTNGVCTNKAKLDGFFLDTDVNAYRYFTAGIMTTGEATVYPEVYFFDANGIAVSGEHNILGYKCLFNEKGAFVSSTDSSVVDAGFSGTNIMYVLLDNGLLKVGGKGAMKDYTSNGIYPAWIIQNEMTAVTSIEIGKDITSIGSYGFYRNGYVHTVTFEEGSSLQRVGYGAFSKNWRLTGITFPASVEVLEDYAVYSCGALKYINFEEGSKLHTIGFRAFSDDHGLETVYIPDTVTNIGRLVFEKASTDVVLNVVEDSYAYYYAIENKMSYKTRKGNVYPLHKGTLNNNINWSIYPNGTLYVDGTGAMPNFANNNEQPWGVYGHLVKTIVIGKDITEICNYAFAYMQNVTEIKFNEGSALTTIGALSFRNCAKVTNIAIPNSVEIIKGYAFDDCYALESLYMSQNVSNIKNTAFGDCNKMVMSVAKDTYGEIFAKENGLNYVVRDFEYIPLASGTCGTNAEWNFYGNGVLKITGSGAMSNLTNHSQQPWAAYRHLVDKIVIGKDITVIGDYAFAYTPNVTEVEFEEGSVLTTIGALSFRNCAKVKSVAIPNSVEIIKGYAFDDCYGLESLYMSQNVSNIKNTAFGDCNKMVMSVAEGTYAETFAKANGINCVVRDFEYIPLASGSCGANAEWSFYGNGVLKITGSGAMTNLTSHSQQPWAAYRHLVEKIVIGKDITVIGDYAFAYTPNVTVIEFEEGSVLTTIGALSFRNCAKVKSVAIPNSVEIIKGYAFDDCYGLESLYMSQNVSNIKNTAFGDCNKMVMSVAEGTYAETFAKANGINYAVRDFEYIPLASGTCGVNADWSFYGNGVLKITGNGAMSNLTNHSQQPWAAYRHLVEKIVIGKDITTIGDYAFAYTPNVTEVEFEKGSALTTIGALSFRNCAKITSVVLPDSVEVIKGYAFNDCYQLKNFYMSNNIKDIKNTAFGHCDNMVMTVGAGTYGEKFAKANNIDYLVK